MNRWILVGAVLATLSGVAETREIKMLPGEEWRGIATYYGPAMPYTEKTALTVDLRVNGWSNQYASLLLSNCGRVIWSDRQAAFTITNGMVTVLSDGPVTVTEAGKTLRDAFLFASKTYFPPSGRTPDLAFFTAPQYNTWIELTYNQNEKDILAYAQSMLDNGLPPGVLMIDDTWQTAYGDWDFDRRRFTDPRGMVAQLKAKGFKVILWICPWVGMDTPAYRLLTTGVDPFSSERKESGGFLMDVAGRKPAVDDWWNGRSALLDLTHPRGRGWFGEQLDRLVADYGVDGFKLDGGALPHYTRGYRAHKNIPSGDQANHFAAFALKYPVCEYRHAWKFGGQPVVERLHDKRHTWNDLRVLIPSLIAGGLLGHPFMCPDMIGGGEWRSFLPGTAFDPELFIRSAQVHALCGQMQFSASPWRLLSQEHQKIIRDVVAIRQKFAPQFVELAKDCGCTGEPMIRALDYMFPGQGYGKVSDQFVMGDFLMVAPQVEKGMATRTVLIPPGRWCADDGQVYEGPSETSVDTPLARLPYFVKESAGMKGQDPAKCL